MCKKYLISVNIDFNYKFIYIIQKTTNNILQLLVVFEIS